MAEKSVRVDVGMLCGRVAAMGLRRIGGEEPTPTPAGVVRRRRAAMGLRRIGGEEPANRVNPAEPVLLQWGSAELAEKRAASGTIGSFKATLQWGSAELAEKR